MNKAFNAIKSDGKKFFEKFEQWHDELIEAIQKFFKFVNKIKTNSKVLKRRLYN